LILTTITPHRGRLSLLRNHLQSLAYQTRVPDEVLVVSHGDTAEDWEQIPQLIEESFPWVGKRPTAAALRIGDPGDYWHKALAINHGIRRSRADADVICLFDVDMVLHPEHLEHLLQRQEGQAEITLCTNLSLAKTPHNERLFTVESFEAHRSRAQWIAPQSPRNPLGPISYGWGGCQAAPREWWFKIRGYDEDFRLFGPEDKDIIERAKATDLPIEWMPPELAMLHQYHAALQLNPRMWKIVLRNYRMMLARRHHPTRNPTGWGGVSDE